MKIILLSIFFLFIFSAKSQGAKSIQFDIEGQISIASDGDSYFTNFGGPGIKFKRNQVDFSFNMMPSIRFHKNIDQLHIQPILGFGPQLYFLRKKHIILSFPAYFYSSTQQWTFTAGFGVVLSQFKRKNSEN
jgi:hypothetical protein